jgi:hypothetical protein
MNNHLQKNIANNFEPEMIQSKPLTQKEREKLSQIILESKAKNSKKLAF